MASPREKALRREPALAHRGLLTLLLVFLAVGALAVYSASSARSLLEGQGSGGSEYLVKYVGYGAIGIIAMLIVARTDLARVRQFTPILLVGSIGLCFLVFMPGIGVEVNGARRWIGTGALQFQPSELLKLALVLYVARVVADDAEGIRTLPGLFRPVILVTCACCFLIILQPDLDTACVIAFVVFAMLLAGGARPRDMSVIAGGGAFAVMVLAIAEPYRVARLTSFLSGGADTAGAGFQSTQGEIAVGSGGLFGVGIGESVQKVYYLPEAHTDFVLAVIGEETGLLGIGVVLGLYVLFGWLGFGIARNARGLYAQLLAAGFTVLVLCQATINIFAVLGLAPVAGIPLPFISSGSSSLVVMLFGTGLLLNIAQGGTVQHLRVAPRRRRRRRRPPPPRRVPRDRGEETREWERSARAGGRGRDRGPRRAGARGRGRAAG